MGFLDSLFGKKNKGNQNSTSSNTANDAPVSININGRKISINQEDLIIDQIALNAYESGNYSLAVEKYSELIRKNPSAFQYYKFRGTAYEDMGNDVLAKKDFVKAVSLCDTDSTALYRLAMVYHRENNMASAIQYLEKAYQHMPTYENLMGNTFNNILFVHKRVIAANLANFLTLSNRVSEGIRLLDEVISNCPDYAYPYYVKAITVANQKNYREALQLAEKAQSLGHQQAGILAGQLRAALNQNQASSDKYSRMVANAMFNPFNITIDPSLQNATRLPDMTDVFRQELNNTFSHMRGYMDDMKIVTSYIFNLAESYYNNAGYIPKNTLDEIIEAVYNALKQTPYRDAVSNLDALKYNVYYSLLNK